MLSRKILPCTWIFRNSFRLISSSVSSLSHSTSSSSTTTKTHYDIVIVGGGMVGGTLASALGHEKVLAEKSILLLEGAPKFKGVSGEGEFSNRVSTLNGGTLRLLDSIGVWEQIKSVRAQPVYDMQVWDASSNAYITFERNSEPIAHVVENDLVLDTVFKSMANLPNITIKYDSRIENFKLPSSESESGSVFLKSGEEFSCNLLIGADGANSSVRKAMNVNVLSTNYNQMGVVATLALDGNSIDSSRGNNTAWQRYLPDGPIAVLPLNAERSSLVWTTTPENAKRLVQMTPEEFVSELNTALSGAVKHNQGVSSVLKLTDSIMESVLRGINQGGGKQSGLQRPPAIKAVMEKSRAAFPLGFAHASSYVDNGVALIGDAAHRIHPLAGQGVNLGYGDVSCLVERISEAVYNGGEVNSMDYLRNYQTERLRRNVPIMVGVHGLQRLYSTDFPPVVLLRSLGLKATHSMPFVKDFFIKRAMA